MQTALVLFHGIVLGRSKKDKGRPLPTLLRTDDEVVGNIGHFGDSEVVLYQRGDSRVWAGGAGPALAGWVAKKTRAGSSLRAKFFFVFVFFVCVCD